MKPPLLENLRTESLSCIIHQANIADCVIVLCNFLPLEISPLNEWSFDSNVVFPCKTLTFTQKYICIEIKSITLVVYKNINCFVDKLLAMALVTSYINCSIIIIIIIIIIIMITTTIIMMMIIIKIRELIIQKKVNKRKRYNCYKIILSLVLFRINLA